MSWNQLLEIKEQNRQHEEEIRDNPPVACPNDGEPLKEGPDGRLFCPWDGWRPSN